MQRIRTLIIDDEPLARERIKRLLEQLPEITILDECRNGREAKDKISKYKPDLIFLDIQMPDINGFEVLKSGFEPKPYIIFVTAFDEFALKAFDVQAIDYLLKPFEDERFFLALEHAKDQIELNRLALIQKKVAQVMEQANLPLESGKEVIWLKLSGRNVPIKIVDVFYFESDGNYVRIHLESRSFLYRETLQQIEDWTDGSKFVRIHRSILIHSLYLDRVHYEGNNRYILRMKNGIKLNSSRSYKHEIEYKLAAWLSGS